MLQSRTECPARWFGAWTLEIGAWSLIRARAIRKVLAEAGLGVIFELRQDLTSLKSRKG